ncbi:PP2C-domain-containing protein, partial [Sporormia fimetaria CBS 119925]
VTMTRNADRHASSESSSSWRSTDTVRGPFRSRPTVRTTKSHNYQTERESEVSPGTVPPAPPPKDPMHRPRRPSNWESSHIGHDFRDYRKQLAVLDTAGGRIPSISRNPPTATSPVPPSFPSSNGSALPATAMSFFNDSNEDLAQLSPGFRPGSGRDEVMGFSGDARRPSVVSTVSSSGSKSSSRGYHKPLKNIFGEDFPGDSRQNSDTSLPTPYGFDAQSARLTRNRTNSFNNPLTGSIKSRPASPAPSRPRTPQPSSEVTPWEFQDYYSYKEVPAQGENGRPSSEQQHAPKISKHHHNLGKLRLPGHRHNRSKEDNGKSEAPTRAEISHPYPLRPMTSRDDSTYSIRRDPQQNPSGANSGAVSKTNLLVRPSSPTPSALSDMSLYKDAYAQRSPSTTGKSRNLLQRLTGARKHDRSTPESLRDLPSSAVSLQTSSKTSKHFPRQEPSPGSSRKRSGVEAGLKDKAYASSKEGKSKFQLMSSKKHHFDQTRGKDPNEAKTDLTMSDAMWRLDTDLDHMEGIVQPAPMTPPVADMPGSFIPDDFGADFKDHDDPRWDAPDSWAVQRHDQEQLDRYSEYDENGIRPEESDNSKTYCVRIFRVDSTFATLSATLNTSVSEIIGILGKKTLLQDDLHNYHIVMRKHDTSRQLDPNDRPLLLQKRLLEQAGYTDADRLEEIGREDNSYLCRFTFIPAKLSGYASLDKDPGFAKSEKFTRVNLQGRNLITIPIIFYQKATEIVSLDLSRNLSLDVPKDFITTCTNLREIKYTSNEARRLPSSFGLASRLTLLDVSNNRLQNLDKAELQNLQSLQGLRLSNNRLTHLPSYFGRYRALRSLNLSSNSLNEFPDFLCDIRTLVDLDISFNSISSIPRIGQLTCLERLWATNNILTGSFPPSLANLVNLREIDVRFNKLDNMDVMSQLPSLLHLMIGHNNISAFEGYFSVIRTLHMDHNPVTRFGITAPVPSLAVLNLASAKLSTLPDDLFGKISGLTKLILDKNHFTSLSPNIGSLYRLDYLSVAENQLKELPVEIGRLTELSTLDAHENNLGRLPPEIWYARRLETLNVSSNVLKEFPKPTAQPPPPPTGEVSNLDGATPASTPGLGSTQNFEELGRLEDFQNRRPSQASGGYLSSSFGSSSSAFQRKGSMASYSTARKPSVASRSTPEGALTPVSRKDSSLSSKLATTFAGSLQKLYLAENHLTGDVFDELVLLPELKILNLSYNVISDIPSGTIRRWHHITDLYLSGNDLSSFPAEDLEEVSQLKTLHINGNKFQVLPAELGKVTKLAVLDVSSNLLKYNVSNWPYDWNWNWNHNLTYLNLSGNKRLEIKPTASFSGGAAAMRGGRDLTDFTSLANLRVLGLMDVTMMTNLVPEQSEDKRVRTTGSMVGFMAYGMADSLGNSSHLSTMDMVIPRFRSRDDEQLLGLFEGQSLTGGGSKIVKYLYDNFKIRFAEELDRLRAQETPADALRRTYLGLNKEIATAATQALDRNLAAPPTQHRGSLPDLSEHDSHSGSVATVIYLREMELYISNVGDAQALLIRSQGGHKVLTHKHDPAEANERTRIREAGGFVSRQGKLNDSLEVSRAFGYVESSPSVIASPHILNITVGDSDEMILIASRELWEYMTPDYAVETARSERHDLMRAAAKLRDLAISFGATNKIMVLILGVNGLKGKLSMGPSGSPDEFFTNRPRGARRKQRGANVLDSQFDRLDAEIPPPTGQVSLVFTDIKNSTLLWETYPIAMRSAIAMHNKLMRKALRLIGGYEVKTEGDAFMVAFPTVTSALLWCFTIQSQLLEVPWPQEILNSVNGQEVMDADGNVIFRGLSVRMGIHYGSPVCELDPVTGRMDYFGPMVNRASRISSVADGGQITVSADFISEIQRLIETHEENERSMSMTSSDDAFGEDKRSQAIRQELRALNSQGFEVKDLGERRLKGLENPEYIYLMYPHSLASRLTLQRQLETAQPQPQSTTDVQGPTRVGGDSELTIDPQNVWDLWSVSLRLEMLCSTLENPGAMELKAPETQLLERMKNRSHELTDRFLVNFVEHQISRIETCTTTLALRHMVRPFGSVPRGSQACPMDDILGEVQKQLKELQ